jgi:hypothetical protein
MKYFFKSVHWHERSQLPNVSAVYAFANAAGDLLYIGSSRNLRKRVLGHNHRNTLSENDVIHWKCVEKSRLLAAEARLIDELEPLWNAPAVSVETCNNSWRLVESCDGQASIAVLTDAVADNRLSWRARGILFGCLAFNDPSKITRSWIIENGKEGKDAVLSALAELKKFGYLVNTKTRNQLGLFSGDKYFFTDNSGNAKKVETASRGADGTN